MRFFGTWAVCFLLSAGAAYAQDNHPAGQPAAGGEKSAGAIGSYGIGMSIGHNLKNDGVEIDQEAFLQGLRDALQGTPAKYTGEQLQAAMEIMQRDAQAKKEQDNRSVGDKNSREGAAYLASNKSKPGVVTLPSGLQYQVLKAGTGSSPKATDTVKVHYEGTLLDGSVFDSSIKRKEPATFPVNGVIPGWTEALQHMKVGDRWRLVIPSELAYGAHGAGDAIGPNAVLIFEVELLDIQPSPSK